jgi:hypothetical protein
MKKLLLFIILSAAISSVSGQKVDSIYFHLYTDSLKKGQNNYINVDGKLSDGRWVPLTSKEIIFFSESLSFSGNEVIIPENFKERAVKIKATLRSSPFLSIEKTIWIKQLPDPPLKSKERRY